MIKSNIKLFLNNYNSYKKGNLTIPINRDNQENLNYFSI